MKRLFAKSRHTGRLSRRPAFHPQAEVLESRQLLAVTINEFAIPTPNSLPQEITRGPDGNLWFTESSANKIGKLDSTTGVVTEYPLPFGEFGPAGITTGPDGNLYFTFQGSVPLGFFGGIDRISTSGVLHGGLAFPVYDTMGGHPGITLGPDGNLWFTNQILQSIGRISTTGPPVTEFSVPAGQVRPLGITSNPDGNLWVTVNGTNQIDRFSTAGGVTDVFPLPAGQIGPAGITLGPDGNLWVTVSSTNQIDRITQGGAITTFAIPTANSQPRGITTGPDGNLWFAESATNRIGVINPTTGVVAEYPTPTVVSGPFGITAGSDGNLWFTENNGLGNKIGQVHIDGPTVVSAQRFGSHTTPTTLVLTFDTPLDPGRATNLANYRLASLGRFGQPIGTIGIDSAVYDPAKLTVTLRPHQLLSLHRRFQLTVVGTGPSGVTDTVGHLLDGQKTGNPGSNFVTTVTAANLMLKQP